MKMNPLDLKDDIQIHSETELSKLTHTTDLLRTTLSFQPNMGLSSKSQKGKFK